MGAVRIGTRGSRLAVAQARWVVTRLRDAGTDAEVRIIHTTGDRARKVPLATLGGSAGIKGVFTKEIEDALLAGEIDLAVHSLKDLPTELPGGLSLGCVPQRADPRDVLLGGTLASLPEGAVVGTGSRRRTEQLGHLRPDVSVADIRGNVDTRIRKLRSGGYDAIVLAAAGLERLGRLHEVAEYLPVDVMVPAAGQGALGIEVRTGDPAVLEVLSPLHDARAAAEVRAERALLRALGGGCEVPVGAHAALRDGRLTLVAAAAGSDGGMVRVSGSASPGAASVLGDRVAGRLRLAGAACA